jgi:hypothetical protein
MKKLLLLVSIIATGYFVYTWAPPSSSVWRGQETATESTRGAMALDSGSSGRQLQGQGTVTRILPDDNVGSRHQRFIIKLPSGQTLLVAHNIDIAPRIGSLAVGDTIAFNGEYEWNPKGGVIHWTHNDPGGRHPAGWLKHGNQTYQ